MIYMNGFEAYNITQMGENGVQIRFFAKLKQPRVQCAHCDARLSIHGLRNVKLRAEPMHGKRVQIVLERVRYRCRACGHAFTEPWPDGVVAGHFITRSLLKYMCERRKTCTAREIADELGMSERNVRRITSG